MGDNMEGGAWSRRSSGNDEGKFREAMGWLVAFFKLKKCTLIRKRHSEHF